MAKEVEFTKIFSSIQKKSKKVSSFWLFKKSWIFTILLILIPLILSVAVRMPSATLPVTDVWAKESVYAGIRSSISQEVTKQYPTLPEAQKAEFRTKLFDQTLSEHKAEVEAEITKYATFFRGQLQNENNVTYLVGIDEYAYYRKAQNVLDTGHIYDKLNNGVPWNDHMIAPLGTEMFFNLHPYVIAYMNKFLSIFGIKDLMATTFWVPILLSTLGIIPIFFLGKKFAGNVGGFVAAVILAVSAPVISRTAGGFADTDAYNVFFPIMIAWLFIEAIERKGLFKKILLGGLAGLTVGIYALVWEWWFIFDLILLVIIGFIGFNVVKSILSKKGFGLDKSLKNNLYAGLTFIAASGIFVSLFKGFGEFYDGLFIQPISYYYIKAVATFKIWPNVMTTVAEQNALSVAKVISAMGGALFFFTALVGIFMLAFDLRKLKRNDWFALIGGSFFLFAVVFFIQPQNAMVFDLLIALPYLARYMQLLWSKEHINIEFSLLSLFWLLFTFYASVRGVRYTLLLAPIYAIGFGITVGKLYEAIQKQLSKGLNIEEIITKAIVVLLLLVLLFNPFQSPTKIGFDTVKYDAPLINDAWVLALTKIKMESQPNAIINSWWDYGHWFKAFADRAVTFDGASQNTPMAHWIGRALLTNDQLESAGIIRMLDCGSNTAFDVLDTKVNNSPKSISLLYEIVKQSKADAASTLTIAGVDKKTIDNVLKYTHCEPPENYFITSADMIQKSGVWAHFGSWNFVRASMFKDVTNLGKDSAIKILKEKYNLSADQSLRYYYEIQNTEADLWIAPWPGYASEAVNCETKNDKVLCVHTIGQSAVPFEIDLKTLNASIPAKEGKLYPDSFVFTADNGGYIKKTYTGETIGLSLNLISPSTFGGTFQSVVSQANLAESTFTKLYFYAGKGMNCFTPFTKEREFTGGNLYVWKLNWSCLPS